MKRKLVSVCCGLVVALAAASLIHMTARAQPATGDKGAEARKPGASAEGVGGDKDKAAARNVPEVSTTTARPAETREVKPRKVATSNDSPQTYVMRLRSLSERIATLKERVSQTKYRLSLLKEAVLHGTIAGCQLKVHQDHRMGSSFRLISIRYALDGKGIYGKEDIGDTKLAKTRKLPIFSGPIPPGPHVLTVELKWRGHGYGVFSYLRGYKFRVLSSHSFKATEGTETAIRVKAYEKGNMTTPLKDRPAIKFIRKTRVIQPKSKVKGAKAAKAGKGKDK